MSSKSAIEWTDATWNPIRGCSRVSEGCRHCYAERFAGRFAKPGEPWHGFVESREVVVDQSDGRSPINRFESRWTGKMAVVEKALDLPLRWRKPRRIFVNSMSDLFHEGLKDREIAAVFAVMALAPRHTFQVLTKRPERMRDWMAEAGRRKPVENWMQEAWEVHVGIGPRSTRRPPGALTWPLPNVWLGVSVEDQATADARIPVLLDTPAAVRWCSYEPALAAVDFTRIVYADRLGAMRMDRDRGPHYLDALRGFVNNGVPTRLSWVVVGGESGPGARPFDVAWARSVVAQCRAAGVQAFVKQLGRDVLWDGVQGGYGDGVPNVWPPGSVCVEEVVFGGRIMKRMSLRDHKGSDPAQWPEDLRVRELPAVRG